MIHIVGSEATMTTVSIDKAIFEDLVKFKRQHIDQEIKCIIGRWNYQSIEKFLEGTRDGSIQGSEMDAIALRQLITQCDQLMNVRLDSKKRKQPALDRIEAEINRARNEFTGLQDNWDGEGSKSIKEDTIDRASDFLIQLAEKMANEHGVLVDVPRLNPGNAGEIEISWETGSFILSIDIPEKLGAPAIYYGDNHGDFRIKGAIDVEHLFQVYVICKMVFR